MAQNVESRTQRVDQALLERIKKLMLMLRGNITWRKALSGSFRRRFEEAVTNMSQGIGLYDSDNRLLLVNEQFCRIYNQPMSTLKPGMSFRDILAQSIAVGNYPGRTIDDVWNDRKAFIDRREPGTFFQELGDGRLIAILHQPLADGGWVATYEDVTERRRAELQVKFMAQHDALTQLPNRLLFGERLEAAIAASRQGQSCALICLDLDGFKLVNDRLGHAAGDMLLRQVAERLQAAVRGDDIAARLGGDEFALLLMNTSAAQAQQLSERVSSDLRREYQLPGFGPAHVDVSIGIACAPDHADAADTLLSHADKALYIAKHAGRVAPYVYNARLPVAIKPRPRNPGPGAPRDGLGALRAAGAMVDDLRVALQSGEVHLEYQAVCDCDTTRPVAYEALLRWVDPIRGTVPPAEFIPAAEDSGFIVTLSEWVLRQACKDAAGWTTPFNVCVNLSPLNFSQPDLVATIASVLAEAGLSPSRLIIEITEGVLLDNSPAMQERIHGLRMLGVDLWLDDFGTGYANFATLASAAFSAIKIDRVFLADGLRGRSILRAMITLGQTCGLKVIAEGVETMEQFDLLRSLGCDRVQGYLLGAPMPAGSLDTSPNDTGYSHFD
jgi:diguanylate cyclase (GGDEF)-like protein